MPDYGHDVQFGFFLDPTAGDVQATLETGDLLDELGFDLAGIQDHPYQANHFDSLTLCSFILARTTRLRVFPDVANLPLRPPVMLAKQSATIDQLSGGRFELGLGAGAFWKGVEAMGGPRRQPKDALGALREGIDLIRSYWSGKSIRHDGTYYRAMGARPGPVPAHAMSIWLGVVGPRALALTGETADGWVPSMAYVSPAKAIASNAIIDRAAEAAGRSPADIRRIYNIAAEFSAQVESGASDDDTQIVGPVEHWVAALTHLAVDIGFSSFVLWGEPAPERLRLFIEEVAPAVRERVAQVRAERGSLRG